MTSKAEVIMEKIAGVRDARKLINVLTQKHFGKNLKDVNHFEMRNLRRSGLVKGKNKEALNTIHSHSIQKRGKEMGLGNNITTHRELRRARWPGGRAQFNTEMAKRKK